MYGLLQLFLLLFFIFLYYFFPFFQIKFCFFTFFDNQLTFIVMCFILPKFDILFGFLKRQILVFNGFFLRLHKPLFSQMMILNKIKVVIFSLQLLFWTFLLFSLGCNHFSLNLLKNLFLDRYGTYLHHNNYLFYRLFYTFDTQQQQKKVISSFHAISKSDFSLILLLQETQQQIDTSQTLAKININEVKSRIFLLIQASLCLYSIRFTYKSMIDHSEKFCQYCKFSAFMSSTLLSFRFNLEAKSSLSLLINNIVYIIQMGKSIAKIISTEMFPLVKNDIFPTIDNNLAKNEANKLKSYLTQLFSDMKYAILPIKFIYQLEPKSAIGDYANKIKFSCFFVSFRVKFQMWQEKGFPNYLTAKLSLETKFGAEWCTAVSGLVQIRSSLI